MSLTSDGIPVTMPVTPSGGYGNGGMGFGGDGAWWLLVLFLFVFCGWGNNGWGGNGGMNGAATQGALTREQACIDNNFNNLMRETAGIADSVNLGFSNLNSTICNAAYENAGLINGLSNTVQQGFNAQTIATLQGQNALQTQIAGCCCDAQQTMSAINNNISSQGCDTRYALQSMTRDIITNQNDNARAVLDKLTAQEIAAKDAQITALNQQLFRADLAASQQAQNNYLVNTLRPCPQPAYITCSPFQSSYGIGLNNGGCGCGCNGGYAA